MGSKRGSRGRSTVRVLYVQPSTGSGGAERQAALVSPLLDEWDVEVLPHVGSSEMMCRWMASRGVGEAVLSQSFPSAKSCTDGAAKLLRPARYLSARRAVADEVEALIREREIDVVYAGAPFAWLAATEPARRLGVPVVWRAGCGVPSAFDRVLLRTWARLYPPDLVLCSSDAARRAIEPLVAAPAEVVWNGVELDRWRPLARGGAPHGSFVVGFAGPLRARRGVRTFVEMAARLAGKRADVGFVVAGEGPERPADTALAEAHGLGGRMRFLGFVDDIAAFYAACDVVVVPSETQGCPHVLLEAMAARKPLVVSGAVATGARLAHAEEALVFPTRDAAACADAVDRLCTEETLRSGLARRAYERVRRDHDIHTTARRIARALRMVAAMNGLHVMPGARRELLAGMRA